MKPAENHFHMKTSNLWRHCAAPTSLPVAKMTASVVLPLPEKFSSSYLGKDDVNCITSF